MAVDQNTQLRTLRVGIFAASSPVPEIEFAAGVAHLRDSGFEPVIHAQVPKRHFTFAGRDNDPAGASYDSAIAPGMDFLGAAGGGYGAGGLLPILDQLTRDRGV